MEIKVEDLLLEIAELKLQLSKAVPVNMKCKKMIKENVNF